MLSTGIHVLHSSAHPLIRIDPKVKEREEKKREDKIYRSSYPENEQRLPNYRLAADFENAGVGIVVNNTCINALQEVEHINGRIMTATFRAHGGDVRLVCAYARPIVLIPKKTRNTFMIN